MWLILFLDLV